MSEDSSLVSSKHTHRSIHFFQQATSSQAYFFQVRLPTRDLPPFSARTVPYQQVIPSQAYLLLSTCLSTRPFDM